MRSSQKISSRQRRRKGFWALLSSNGRCFSGFISADACRPLFLLRRPERFLIESCPGFVDVRDLNRNSLGGHIRSNVVGAMAPQSGQFFGLIVDGVDTDVFQYFLEKIAKADPK